MSRDISLLHPRLRAVIPQIIERCAAVGLPVLVTDGYRTQAEQDALYAKGRTAPGGIVTNVRWPNSAHCWGVAFDFCRNVRGREYDDGDRFFERVAEIAKPYGLDWGGDWKNFVDKPHLQLREFMPGNSTAWLARVWGSPAAFRESWDEEEPEELAAEQEEDMKAEDLMKIEGTGDNPSPYHKAATEWAKAMGIFRGDGHGNYGWQAPVTREQLAQAIYNLEHCV